MNNKIGVLSNKNKFFEKIFDVKDNNNNLKQSLENTMSIHFVAKNADKNLKHTTIIKTNLSYSRVK